MITVPRLRRTALSVAAASLLLTTALQAEEVSPAEASITTLDSIEVTAQRRVQMLEDVPLAVTAVNADQLQSRGIENIGDLNAVAPGLNISQTISNTTISQISIRGVTQINPAIYWDPAVGVYVDGVYIGKAQGSIFNVIDLHRIEVLRGPQGTLYGRNTLAGAINLVTRSPSGVFGGSVSIDMGNHNALTQRVSVDLPKMGIVYLSLAARSERRDGWIEADDRLSSRNELNNRQNDGFRLAADFDFSERLVGEYRFDRSNVNQSNNFTQLVAADAWTGLQPLVNERRQTRASVDAPSFEQASILGHSFTLNYEVSEGLSLKSISGYRRMDWDDSLDLDGTMADVAHTQRFTGYEQWSQDLQLVATHTRWDLVGGLYYFADEGHTDNPQRFFGGSAVFDSRYGTETSAWAAYGQVDFRPIDSVTLSAGLRYTRERKSLDRAFGVETAPGSYFYLIPDGTEASDTFSASTPMFSAAWRISEAVNVYARYAEGFKSGGFNGEFSQPPTGDPAEDIPALIALNIDETRTPFRPEKSRTYELGLKALLAGGRAQFNAALFHNTITDLQASIFLGSGAAATVIRNAGEATVQGLELEAAFIPVRGTTIRANLALLDPEYDEFVDGGVNVANNRAFVHAPDYTWNLVIDSELLRRDWGALRATVDYAYTDDFFTYPYQLEVTNPMAQVAEHSRVKGHGLLNLRLALIDLPWGNGRGEVALWGRNLLDEDTATNFIDFGPGFGGIRVANFVEPRTYGITGIFRW